jgi:hypothetical protein
MPRLHITLTQDQHDELRALATLTGKKLSTLANQAVSEFLSDQTEQTRRAIRLEMRELDEQRAMAAIEERLGSRGIAKGAKIT